MRRIAITAGVNCHGHVQLYLTSIGPMYPSSEALLCDIDSLPDHAVSEFVAEQRESTFRFTASKRGPLQL